MIIYIYNYIYIYIYIITYLYIYLYIDRDVYIPLYEKLYTHHLPSISPYFSWVSPMPAVHGRPMAMPLWRQNPSADPALGSCTEVNVLRIGALAEVRKNAGEGPWGGHGILGY